MADQLQTAQVWVVDAEGGYMYSDNLSHELRMALQPVLKFRQFCDVKDATHQGLHKGDTFNWNVYKDVATQGTYLAERTTMPETNFEIVQESLIVDEQGNSVPYSGKLDDLSLHPVREIVRKVLKNDAKKALDIAAASEFNRTMLRAVGAASGVVAFTEDGAPDAANTAAMGKDHVKAISDYMKERNIPAFINDDYYCMSRPSTFRPFKDELEDVHKYVDQGFQYIMNGEIGRYEGVRFVEQTNIIKYGLGTGVKTVAGGEKAQKDQITNVAADSTAWTGALSDWAVFFGEDTVAEAIVCTEEIRGKIPSDYGRAKGVAWYYLGGFGIVHSDPENARIVLWDSLETPPV